MTRPPSFPPVRFAIEKDIAEIARLLTELGHPTTATEVTARWPAFTTAGNQAIVAPGPEGRLFGLATLHATHVLHRPRPVGRITALVVDATVRRGGLGRLLMQFAEANLAARGCGLIEVTSNLRRGDAHAFYERLGYARTSLRFAKTLAHS